MSQERLLKELGAMEAVQTRMRGLLNEIASVLKGPADPRAPHDWHDLAEIAEKLVIEHRHLKNWWASHMEESAGVFERLADVETVRREAEEAGYRRGVVATLHKMQGRLRALPDPDAIDPDEVL